MGKQNDVVVIGSGPGGYVAAIRCAQLGLKTACIEKMSSCGGTCLNVGCIPSKALLQSSENYMKILKEGNLHGIDFNGVKVNFSHMMDRKSHIVKGLTDSVSALLKKNHVPVIKGNARITSAHLIEVTQEGKKELVEAEKIIIATGSEPISLPFLSFDEKKVVSSTGALNLPEIPKKMVVVGAGIIGVELASVYSRLGTEVTIVEMLDHICPAMDNAISKMLLQILKKQGMTFYLSTEVVKAKEDADGIALFIRQENRTSVLNADVILIAIGRRPYSHGLGLKDVGIAVDSRGFIPVDDQFRTSVPNIFAIGDVIDGVMLAHKASEEGIAVAEIIAGRSPSVNYVTIPNVIYTSPEVASVGLTEKESRDVGIEVIMGSSFFKGNPRARCSGEEEGLVKVIGEAATGRLVGMHIIGAHASELIAEGMIAMEKKATLEEIAHAAHAHPTLSECIKESCLAALGRAIHA